MGEVNAREEEGSSRWGPVPDGRTCRPEGCSICESNYCRPPESECRIKLTLRWPNFFQHAVHLKHRAMAKAGVPAERGAIASGY